MSDRLFGSVVMVDGNRYHFEFRKKEDVRVEYDPEAMLVVTTTDDRNAFFPWRRIDHIDLPYWPAVNAAEHRNRKGSYGDDEFSLGRA